MGFSDHSIGAVVKSSIHIRFLNIYTHLKTLVLMVMQE